jgi:rRNA maturation endonuclease Nob1
MRNKLKNLLLEEKTTVDNTKPKNTNKNSIYCSECGTMSEEDAQFCPSCGIKKV